MTALRETDLMPRAVMLPNNVLHVMSDEQLDTLIQKAIQEGFEKGQKKPFEKPLTKKEAAAYMRLHVKSFDLRFKNNQLPTSLRHYVGGSILFFASELEAFIKKS